MGVVYNAMIKIRKVLSNSKVKTWYSFSASPSAICNPVPFTESTNNALLATVATKNAATDKPIFSNYTDVNSLIRNTNNPLHNLEGVTGIIAWNDRKYGKPKGTQLGGYAVTPRHIVSSRHAAYLKGDKVWFVTRDNTLIERTVIAHRSPLYRSVSYTQGDYVIGLLDSDLPASIEPLEALPPDFYKYLDNTEFNGTTWKAKDVFFVHTNQKEQSLFSKLNNIIFKVFEDPDPLTYNPANAGYFQREWRSTNAISEWTGPVIGGDSGSPSMFIVGTKLIPFSVWSTATVGNFFGQARNYNDLNRLIVDTDAKAGISTGYTLTDIDMSGFKVYSQSVPNSTPASSSIVKCNVSCASSPIICNTSSVVCNTITCTSPSTSQCVTPSTSHCISPTTICNTSSPVICNTASSASCNICTYTSPSTSQCVTPSISHCITPTAVCNSCTVIPTVTSTVTSTATCANPFGTAVIDPVIVPISGPAVTPTPTIAPDKKLSSWTKLMSWFLSLFK